MPSYSYFLQFNIWLRSLLYNSQTPKVFYAQPHIKALSLTSSWSRNSIYYDHCAQPCELFFSNHPEAPTKTFLGLQLGEKLRDKFSVKAFPKALSGWSVSVVSEARIPPCATFVRRIPCRIPSRKSTRSSTSSWLIFTLGVSSRWQFGLPGLPRGFYCMYAWPFTHASRWGSMHTSTRPNWLSNPQI